MTKPSRPTALVALLLACALAAVGPVSHGHDDGHSGGDDRHCVICGLRHAPATAPPAPVPPPDAPPVRAVRSSCRPSGRDAAHANPTTRGPPA